MTVYPLEFTRFGTMPRASGVIRTEPEDFIVDEELGFEPTGTGEHVLLQVRKRGLNTDQVARQIREVAEVPRKAVSWSGLKDRRACTSQWFGVHLPGHGMEAASEWSDLESDQLQLLSVLRHNRKLRVGTHRCNHFRIRIRGLHAPERLIETVQHAQQFGVPNYFGAQRFGRNGSNLQRAPTVLAGPKPRRHDFQRGLMLSAIRSWVFNCYLEMRVQEASWDRCLPGDALQFDGSGSFFVVDEVSAEISDRLIRKEVHVTGPLWGAGEPPVQDSVLEMERKLRGVAEQFCELMEQAGLRQERRALRLLPAELQCTFPAPDQAELSFSLPRGGFATSVLREMMDYQEAA